MNRLIVLQDELIAENKACLSGARLERVLENHDLKPGLTIAAALLGGKRGRATVAQLSKEKLTLELNLSETPLPRTRIEIIVAVPRPQTVKKVLQTAAAAGLEKVHFIRSEKIVKSYLQSKTLEEQNIQLEVIKGLEQSGDSLAPEVKIHRFFKPFIREYLPSRLAENSLQNSLRLIADTRAEDQLGTEAVQGCSLTSTAFVAIGPERGWNPYEVEQFLKLGFHSFNLGERVFRVETALAYLLGQLDLLRRIDS